MNEIEEMFYVAFFDEFGEYVHEHLKPQHVIAPYAVDFLFDLYGAKVVIEIDGHEAHKTKEQRQRDYERERYLMSKGYVVIRFTGSEVYLDSHKCANDVKSVFYGFHTAIKENLPLVLVAAEQHIAELKKPQKKRRAKGNA
jgi:very-short-patch-repair endonuclease